VYDSVLLPPREVADRSIRVSEQLAPLGRFTLREDDTAIPHMSLYMSTHDASTVTEVARRLAGIASSTPVLALLATRHAQMPDGFVEVRYEPIPALVRLQEELLAAINPLRDGLPAETPGGVPFAEAMRLATGHERVSFETWGYPECGPGFRPHISFTRLRDPDSRIDLDGLPAAGEFSGTFSRLALCTMGPNGTCPAIVHEWALGAGASREGR
jgi:hypothetical protein